MIDKTPNPIFDVLAESDRQNRRDARVVARELSDAAKISLSRTRDGMNYATIEMDGHVETYPLPSRDFGTQLRRASVKKLGRTLTQRQEFDVQLQYEADALTSGSVRDVFVRCATHEGKIYVDQGDLNRSVTEIGPDGVRTIQKAPVLFVRPRGALPLPNFALGGDLKPYQKLTGLEDNSFRLLIGAIISALNPQGPHLITMITGAQNSGKSILLKQARSLIDPFAAVSRSLPRRSEDLWVSARIEYMLSYDNASNVQAWLADDFCRLSTGGGASVRRHHVHDEQFIYDAKRPIFMTSISIPSSRQDFLSRSLVLRLRPRRRVHTEEELAQRFQAIAPETLGVIYEGLSLAIRERSDVPAPQGVRMVDAARLVTAAEPKLGWPARTFLAAYKENQREVTQTALEDDPVGSAILEHMRDRDLWEGSATDLLRELRRPFNGQGWPNVPNRLSESLHRIEPALKQAGWVIEKRKSSDKQSRRLIVIRRASPTKRRLKLKRRA